MFDPFPYNFDAVVDRYDYGSYAYLCVYLPDNVTQSIATPGAPRPRVGATLNGHELEAGLNPSGDGRLYIILGRPLLTRLHLSEGDPVRVALRPIDPAVVHEPTPLALALDDAPDLRTVWDGLSPGTKRGFVHRLTSAKRPETQNKRLAEILGALDSDHPSPYPKRRR